MGEAVVPNTMDNYIGIEIEFITHLDRDTVARRLFDHGLQYISSLVGDCSINVDNCGDTGLELRLLIRQEKLKYTLKFVEGFLRSIKAKANNSCGLHVHLDMRQRNKFKAFSNLLKAEPLLFKLNPINRMRSRFCAPTTVKTITKNPDRVSRYMGINQKSLLKHKTLEVRIHKGTVNIDEIYLWSSLLTKIVDGPKLKEIVDHPAKLELDLEHKEYVQKYFEQYQKEHNGSR